MKKIDKKYYLIVGIAIIVVIVVYFYFNYQSVFSSVSSIFEILSYIAVIFGVPFGLYEYRETKRKERLDREYGTYDEVDAKYTDFLNLCLQYPYLNVFDAPDAKPRKLNEQQKKEELIIFTWLIALFERVYLMYHDQSTEIKRKQWIPWRDYIIQFCKRENFRRTWKITGDGWDTQFQAFMENLIAGKKPVQ